MLGILGRKLGMTQAFDQEGRRCGLTVVEAGPCVVIQVKTAQSDGYDAVQLGFDPLGLDLANRPQRGHVKKAGAASAFRVLGEFRVDDASVFTPGQQITVDKVFQAGQLVDVVGTSKGKGFAGTIKRHHFSRGPMTHGSMNKRQPGSVGASAWPSRVIKGKRLPGHMGDKQISVQMIRVYAVDPDKHLLFLHGAAPGGRNGLVRILPAVKDHGKGDGK